MRISPGKRRYCFGLPLAAVLTLAACMGPRHQQRIRVGEIHKPEENKIQGVTTIQGGEIEFDNYGTLTAPGMGGKVKGAQ